MKLKSLISVILAISLFALSGCTLFCKHEWTEATCTAPKTCSLCQKTEGAELGHEWNEATCTVLKTCSRCAVTEGELAPHDMKEANYQAPSTCNDCGHTEGGKLTPFYVSKGATVITAEMGKEYNYKTGCYTSGSRSTTGKLWWENYEVFTSKEGYEEAEGYEWHTVTVKIRFYDENAQTYGFVVQPGLDDYYTGDTSPVNDNINTFKVNFNGEIYDKCLMQNSEGSFSAWKNGSCTYTGHYAWRVPVGYNGHVIMFYHSSLSGQNVFDNLDKPYLFFVFE